MYHYFFRTISIIEDQVNSNGTKIKIETDVIMDSEFEETILFETEGTLNAIDSKIKVQKDSIDGYEFEGIVSIERNSPECIDLINFNDNYF